MWLLVVLQVYLYQIINLNTKVLKVLQVSLKLFIGIINFLGIITYAKSLNF